MARDRLGELRGSKNAGAWTEIGPYAESEVLESQRVSDKESADLTAVDDANWRRQSIPIATISSPIVSGVHAYWQRLRGKRPFPLHSELSLREMVHALRNLVLVRVLDGGAEFQYRIAGDAVVALHGSWIRHSTMAAMDRFYPGHGRLMRRVYGHVHERRRPLALRGEVQRDAIPQSQGRRLFFHETAFLPLGNDEVDHVLVATDLANSLPRQFGSDRSSP